MFLFRLERVSIQAPEDGNCQCNYGNATRNSNNEVGCWLLEVEQPPLAWNMMIIESFIDSSS